MSVQNLGSSKNGHLSLLQQAEGKLEIFKRFVEMSGQGLGMADLEGRIIFINSTLCRMRGEEYPENVYQQELFTFYTPETAKRLQEDILPLVRQEGQWVGELALIDKKGRVTPVIENIFLLRDDAGKPLCFATVFTDLSERIQMEEELRAYHDHLELMVERRTAELEKGNSLLRAQIAERKRAEAELSRLKAILDNTSDLVGAASPDGLCLYLNEAGRRMTGFGPDEDLSGRRMQEIHAAWAWRIVEKEGIPAAIERGVWEGETALRTRDGLEIPVSQVIIAHRSASGELDYLSTIMRDISERKQAEEVLRTSEAKYRLLHDSMRDAFLYIELDGTIREFNDAYVKMLGYTSEELKTLSFRDITPEKWHALEDGIIENQVLTKGYSDIFEKEYRRKDGTVFPVELRAVLIRDNAGKPSGMWAVVRDITERKQAEEELQKLASVVMHSSELVNLATLDGKMIYLNDAGMKVLGVSADEVTGIHITQVIPDHLLEKVQKEVLPAMMAGGWEGDLEYKNLKSGALTSVHATIFLVKDSKTGTPLYFANLSLDITERKQAEEALRESEERFRGLAESMAELVWIAYADGRSVYHNPRFVEYTGLKEITAEDRWHFVHPEDWPYVQKRGKEEIISSRVFQFTCRLRRRDGVYRWFLCRITPMHERGLWVGTATDIDDLKRAEQALQDNLEILAAAEHIGHMGSWKRDLAGNDFTWSKGMLRIVSFPEDEKISFEQIRSRIHPDDVDGVMRMLQEANEKWTPSTVEFRIILPDGSIRNIVGSVEVDLDPQGKPVHIHGIVQDITERKKLEDELTKVQKLESIGTLAGGLAHDYNNLLSIVIGNMELAKMYLAETDKAYAPLAKAAAAIITTRDLTQQLITFSKGGHPISEIMPIQDVMTSSVDLALSGSGTKTKWKIADDLPEVEIDENQIRQVIHNIVINAREAMPQGGILFIEADTAFLGPDNPISLNEGTYVRLTFRDEGLGIDAENLPRVFDPYFTTKEMGNKKGMGLGLSICYSIIKQHSGNIIVESKVGIGTNVTIYIPAAIPHKGI